MVKLVLKITRISGVIVSGRAPGGLGFRWWEMLA